MWLKLNKTFHMRYNWFINYVCSWNITFAWTFIAIYCSSGMYFSITVLHCYICFLLTSEFLYRYTEQATRHYTWFVFAHTKCKTVLLSKHTIEPYWFVGGLRFVRSPPSKEHDIILCLDKMTNKCILLLPIQCGR